MISAQLPHGWRYETLDEVAQLDRTTVEPDQILSGTTYVGLEHLDGDGRFVSPPVVEAGELSSNKFSFNDKHVLYGKLRPYLRKIALPGFSGVCTTEIVPILPGPDLDRRFLFYFLRQPGMVEFATERCSGANLPRLSPKLLAKFPIPIPPLEEQVRLASILDKADAIRRKRKEAIQLTEDLLRSTFLEMFGDPVTNPKAWMTVPLGEMITSATYGPRFYNEAYVSQGTRIVRITDLDSFGRLSFDDMPMHDLDEATLEKFELRPGDVIFARTGATVGKTALIDHDAPRCVAGAYFIQMRFAPEIRPAYAHAFFQSKSVQRIISQKSRQSAQQNFSGPAIRRLQVPVPPLEPQEDFERLRGRLLESLATGMKAMTKSDELFDSLAQRAFLGEL